MTEKSFKDLTDDFNRSAQFCVAGNTTVELLITKYSILMKHKAEQEEDRRALAEALHDQSLLWLKSQCKPELYIRESNVNYAKMLFNRLTEPDSLGFLPRNAPGRLADAALSLLAAAEGSKTPQNDADTIRYRVRMANETLTWADKVKAAQAALPPETAPAAPRKKDELLNL